MELLYNRDVRLMLLIVLLTAMWVLLACGDPTGISDTLHTIPDVAATPAF